MYEFFQKRLAVESQYNGISTFVITAFSNSILPYTLIPLALTLLALILLALPAAGHDSGGSPTKGSSEGHNTSNIQSSQQKQQKRSFSTARPLWADSNKSSSSARPKSTEGFSPKILNESPPSAEDEPEDVKAHNKDMEKRAERPHEQISNEDAEEELREDGSQDDKESWKEDSWEDKKHQNATFDGSSGDEKAIPGTTELNPQAIPNTLACTQSPEQLGIIYTEFTVDEGVATCSTTAVTDEESPLFQGGQGDEMLSEFGINLRKVPDHSARTPRQNADHRHMSMDSRFPNMLFQPIIESKSEEPCTAAADEFHNKTKELETMCTLLDRGIRACTPTSTEEIKSGEELSGVLDQHCLLLDTYFNSFLVAQHPSNSKRLQLVLLRRLNPIHLWRHCILTPLSLLRSLQPKHLDIHLGFLNTVYSKITLFYETIRVFKKNWIEFLLILSGYRMKIENADSDDPEVWAEVTRSWSEEFNSDGQILAKKARRETRL